MTIQPADSRHYNQIVELWEASVRATHHFLSETDIAYFKPLIKELLLPAVDVYIIYQNDAIVAFMGVLDHKLEMLFVHPAVFGKGFGKKLLQFAITQLQITELEVNEQNPASVAFYKSQGFEVTSRSALDGSGKPYPILYMRLKS